MDKSYQKARLKLTLLYFLIILVIVVFFSIIVIDTQNRQFKKFENVKVWIIPALDPNQPLQERRLRISQEAAAEIEKLIKEIKRDNLEAVILMDITILLLASIISYILAGKTMEPIIQNLQKQKRFVSDASHELKTPLTNIKTEAEVLNRSKKSTLEEYKEFTSNVIEDVNRLDELVTYLLDNARIENQTFGVHKDELNLISITEDIANKFRKQADLKQIEIKIDTEDKKEILVNSDKSLLSRLISILIENSIKYNKENGEVLIRITQDKDQKTTIFSIRDNGIGIAPEHINKIFDRFYRVSEDRNEKGFGLGLAIAKQIASELNIIIDVESETAKGTEFKLSFIK